MGTKDVKPAVGACAAPPPLEYPRWFCHCCHRDTVVLKRGLLPTIGPYEVIVIPLDSSFSCRKSH